MKALIAAAVIAVAAPAAAQQCADYGEYTGAIGQSGFERHFAGDTGSSAIVEIWRDPITGNWVVLTRDREATIACVRAQGGSHEVGE